MSLSDARALALYERVEPLRAMPSSAWAARQSEPGLSSSAYRAGWEVAAAGRVVALAMRAPGRGVYGGGARGTICAFTPASRRRMLRTLGAVEWDAVGRPVFLTLTYHAPPTDGRRIKADLEAWRKRWLRRWGQPRGAWKLEFQARGAAHYHVLLGAPAGVTDDTSLRVLRGWVAQSWHEVVTDHRRVDPETGEIVPVSCTPAECPDRAHLRAGVQVDWSGAVDPARYFAKYGVTGVKEYQNERPEWVESVGRWWGLWGIRPSWERYSVPAQEAVLARRVMVRLARSRRGSFRSPERRTSGLWVLGASGRAPLALLGDLERAVGIWRRARMGPGFDRPAVVLERVYPLGSWEVAAWQLRG